MEGAVDAALEVLGKQLDAFSFPAVKNGGIVVPSAPATSSTFLGKETQHGKSRQRRPATGAWTGTASWEGTPRRSGTAFRPGAARQTSSVVIPDLRGQYENELVDVLSAYPGTQFWLEDDGIWLVAESGLLPGLMMKASFVVAVSFVRSTVRLGGVRAWGFWGCPMVGYSWIGPRHTNFPDGSICAFHPSDGTWQIGDSLIELLDLYSLWAVRHLYLRKFGRWPGLQSVPHSYERILELQIDEYCGCENFDRRYGECCRERDRSLDQVSTALGFLRHSGGGLRQPPPAIMKFVLERQTPPKIEKLGI